MRIDSSSSSSPMRDWPIDKQDLNEIKGYINMVKDQAQDGDYKDASANLSALLDKFNDLYMKGNLNLRRHSAEFLNSFGSIQDSINKLANGCQSPTNELKNISQETDYLYNLAYQS